MTSQGKVFAVLLPDGSYVFGKVLLDVYATLKRRLFPANSPLPFFQQCYLVEMYAVTGRELSYRKSDVIIPGAFVQSKEVGRKWPIVAEESVDPERVEFPEGLLGSRHARGDVAFACGEVRVPVPLVERAENHEVKYFFPDGGEGNRVRVRAHSPMYWPLMCLWAMGRRSEIPSELAGITLEHSDLRFSRHRQSIYDHLPFPMDMSYFEKQKMLGLDIGRYYV